MVIAMKGSAASTVRIDHRLTIDSGRSPVILMPAPTLRFSILISFVSAAGGEYTSARLG